MRVFLVARSRLGRHIKFNFQFKSACNRRISSFNKSKEPPAFDFEGVIDFILQYKRAPFDFVVRDSECEGVGVMSSHSQIRPALKEKKRNGLSFVRVR